MHETPVPTSETQRIGLQTTPIDVGAAFAFLQTPRAGAHDLFIGTTRQWTDGRETVELEYEAYEPMAVAEIQRLVDEASARWPVLKVIVRHRLGLVPAGEASILIGVATPHRADAFAACRFLIDTLKRQVPIWKREVYRDGREEWVRGSVPEVPEA